jgi:hypothetical protein
MKSFLLLLPSLLSLSTRLLICDKESTVENEWEGSGAEKKEKEEEERES